MYLLELTDQFDRWLHKLKDRSAKARVLKRLKQVELGNLGDAKSVGGRVYELRITYGPGYRIYFSRNGNVVIILLYGGDKSTQQKDITRAKAILKNLENTNDN